MNISNEGIAKVFKALCDDKRISIVKLLQNGEKCACHISDTLGLSQSKLSYHMKILCESGIVECWYVGKWTHYKISNKGSKDALAILQELTNVRELEESSCKCNDKIAI